MLQLPSSALVPATFRQRLAPFRAFELSSALSTRIESGRDSTGSATRPLLSLTAAVRNARPWPTRDYPGLLGIGWSRFPRSWVATRVIATFFTTRVVSATIAGLFTSVEVSVGGEVVRFADHFLPTPALLWGQRFVDLSTRFLPILSELLVHCLSILGIFGGIGIHLLVP